MRLSRQLVAAAALAGAALAGCAAQAPEERVAALRAEYGATLNSFQVREEPIVPPDATVVAEAGTETGTETALEEGTEPAAPAPAAAAPAVRQDVLLDIVVDNRGDERLPGLTLDVEQVDGEGEAKASYRIWVDTSRILPGARGAVSHRLEDVDYAPGDGFHVEVRQAIPPEERDQYREFAEAAEAAEAAEPS